MLSDPKKKSRYDSGHDLEDDDMNMGPCLPEHTHKYISFFTLVGTVLIETTEQWDCVHKGTTNTKPIKASQTTSFLNTSFYCRSFVWFYPVTCFCVNDLASSSDRRLVSGIKTLVHKGKRVHIFYRFNLNLSGLICEETAFTQLMTKTQWLKMNEKSASVF